MLRIAIIAGVLHSGGKRNLIMEYYRHMDRTKVQYDFICDSDSNGIPEEEIKSLGGRVYKVAPYKNLIPHLKETYKILKENQYEVVHAFDNTPVSYTHLRAHETRRHLVCRLLLEKKKK